MKESLACLTLSAALLAQPVLPPPGAAAPAPQPAPLPTRLLTDEEIVGAVTRLRQRLRRRLSWRFWSDDAIEDVVQHVALKLLQHRARFCDQLGTVDSLAMSSAIRKMIDLSRRRKTRRTVSLDLSRSGEEGQPVFHPRDLRTPDPADECIANELRQNLLARAARKNPRTRRIAEMRLDGHCYDAIAREVGVSVPTVCRTWNRLLAQAAGGCGAPLSV